GAAGGDRRAGHRRRIALTPAGRPGAVVALSAGERCARSPGYRTAYLRGARRAPRCRRGAGHRPGRSGGDGPRPQSVRAGDADRGEPQRAEGGAGGVVAGDGLYPCLVGSERAGDLVAPDRDRRLPRAGGRTTDRRRRAAGREPATDMAARRLRRAVLPGRTRYRPHIGHTMADALKVRPGILDIAPYVGGESSVAGRSRVGRLASNEGALGASPRAIEAYRQIAAELHGYPDGGAHALREAIGRRHGLDPARIVCGAGSDELIGLLARAYAGPGDEVLYSRHGFL